jgi:hypothetical protein
MLISGGYPVKLFHMFRYLLTKHYLKIFIFSFIIYNWINITTMAVYRPTFKSRNLYTYIIVPFVDSKVVVTRDGDDRRTWNSGVGVCRHMSNGWVWQELHDHTHIILYRSEHHRRLKLHLVWHIGLYKDVVILFRYNIKYNLWTNFSEIIINLFSNILQRTFSFEFYYRIKNTAVTYDMHGWAAWWMWFCQ